MLDYSWSAPPIEVAAASPRLDMINARLKATGLRPYPAGEPIDFTAPDPLLVDVASLGSAPLIRAARAVMAGVARKLVFLDIGAPIPRFIDGAIILTRDQEISHLRTRLEAAARQEERALEASLRADVAHSLGVDITPPDIDASPELLYLGEGSPLFLSLQGALRRRGVSVTAALTHHTAASYVRDRSFSAALIDCASAFHSANGLVKWIASDDGPRGIPLIVIARDSARPDERDGPLLAAANVIIPREGRIDAIAAQVETVARRQLAGKPLQPRAALTSRITDLTTGLFNRRFFDAYLARRLALPLAGAPPLSLIVFRFDPRHAARREAQATFAATIRPLLRETDCPSLLQPGFFAFVLPATAFRGAVRLAQRIAVHASRDAEISASGLSWRTIERRAYHADRTFLAAAMTGPFTPLTQVA